MSENDSTQDLEKISERYFAQWEARDPEAIAALHSEDTVFQSHLGTAPVNGREAVRETFAGFFEQFPQFGFETHRVLFGEGFWVLDWNLTFVPEGETERRRFHCLDVVNVDSDGLVARKETFIDMVQLQAALPDVDVEAELERTGEVAA